MANRRMFSLDIVASDSFLDMPTTSRELYFQLCMYADDDGFINPKKIIRLINASSDDLKILITKRFVLPFESGVVVIKHWLIHNTLRGDRYHETLYLEEKRSLTIKENKAYTELATNGLPSGNQRLPQYSIGKVRQGKTTDGFDYFWENYPKKVGKKEAQKSWNKIPHLEESFKKICAALQAHKDSEQWLKDNGKFIPYPATWLNQERWNDELPEDKNKFL